MRRLGETPVWRSAFHFLPPVFKFCDEGQNCDLVRQTLVNDTGGEEEKVCLYVQERKGEGITRLIRVG